MAKKLIVILNGVSLKKKKFYQQILPELQSNCDVVVWETRHPEHAIELGTEASTLNPIGIFAAGGDGTLNQVLNGVLQSKTGHPISPIGVIPLGTGNDFSRLNNILPSSESILNKIENGGKPTDVGLITCYNTKGESVTRYFINVASLGMGPEVVRRLFKSSRALGPLLTYAKASIETFLMHKPEYINIKTDGWAWSGKLRVLAIANGKSFGGGLYVAPEALPDDGALSTFIAAEIPLLKFLILLQKIRSSKKIHDRLIHYNSCKSLILSSPKECWIETEGELAGMLPATIEVIPAGIRFFR